jgi:hypothetical protein
MDNYELPFDVLQYKLKREENIKRNEHFKNKRTK